MNRKNNPWVALIALVLLATILVCICTGCSPAEAAEPEDDRFIVEEVSAEKTRETQHLLIITDTETGVQYIFFKYYNSGGITVLQPAPESEGAEK